MDRTRRIISDIEKFSMLIAHNRASTTGAPINMNAHPFQAGHITLTHNGHVSNAWSLLPAGKTCGIQVDSAQVAAAMELIGEKETLERCQGAFAFVWHNAKDGTLNFARNAGRPLKFCYVKDENTMWWMSERPMLVSILDRHNIKIEGPFFNVPENLWVKFNVKNLREHTTIPFVPRLQGTTRSATTTDHGVNNRTTQNSTQTTAASPSGTSGKDEFLRGSKVAAAQEKLITTILASCDKPTVDELKKREFDLRQNSCRPTGHKKVRRAMEKISHMGFSYDQLVVVDLSAFKTYANQKRKGYAEGTIFNTKVPVHFAALSMEQYMDYKQMDVLLGRVVNYKPNPNGHQSLIIEPHPMAEEFNQKWIARWELVEAARRGLQQQHHPNIRPQLVLPSPKQVSIPVVNEATLTRFLQTGSLNPRPIESGGQGAGSDGDVSSSLLTHCGPNRSTISRGRYHQLTKAGCAMCSGDIPDSVEDSTHVFWINDSPVWTCCNQDPDKMQHQGHELKGVIH